MSALLEIEDLHAGYGNVEIIHGINLKVEEGECVVLVGANGAGKTTTLKTICGLIKPRRGVIRFQGNSIGGVPGTASCRSESRCVRKVARSSRICR